MPEPSNLQSLVDAAEQAAGAGDFAAAAQLLQQAVRLQEAELGPIHPDLANTLNNLGVVCERIGNWTEAERSYRRAHTIAATALPADHPFVATSHQNLIDFCALRGLPLDPSAPAVGAPASRGTPQDFATERQPFADAAPPSAPKTPAPPAPTVRTAAPAAHAPQAPPPPIAPAPPRAEVAKSSSFRGLAIAALVTVGALAVIVAIGPWSRPAESGGNPPQAPVAAPADNPAPPPAPAPQSVPSAPQPAPPPKPETGLARGAAAAAPARSSTPSTEASAPTVVTAQLCRTLRTGGAEWTCTPAGEEVTAGPLYFYTRLKSPADTLVRHRWYRGDQLRQAGELKVGANVSPGYRIYSRHTVSGGAANWRVELMTADGRLLHEERFVVK